MKRIKLAALLISMALSSTVFATDNNSWTGEAELGLVSTTGNTETETFSGKAKVENDRLQWHHTATLETLSAKTSGTKTAERYFVTGKSDYKVSERSYAFARLSYEDDRFSGYEYQANAALGAGYHAIKGERLTLDVEAGPGLRQSKLDDADESEREGTLYLAGLLDWKLSDSANFTEALTVEMGEDATITKSVTGLKSQIVGNLAMKITYTIKNSSDVPDDVEETDTETAVTLVYSF
ncbi:MAG: DUF481 domain-containing protein [Candidatus Polarisedimenticolaceae bacterium]|nr:DUF481 domain-containing protein [Candidatus Polarisedimenticolaceae bacterium]